MDDQCTEADDAAAAFEAIPLDHPIKLTAVFYEARSVAAAVKTAVKNNKNREQQRCQPALGSPYRLHNVR